MMKMVKKTAPVNGCCDLESEGETGCCRVEAIISVDDRGQMVLPKETRDRAGIKAGDKMALVSWERSGSICCMFLIKAEELAAMAKNMLGPIAKEIIR